MSLYLFGGLAAGFLHVPWRVKRSGPSAPSGPSGAGEAVELDGSPVPGASDTEKGGSSISGGADLLHAFLCM